MPRNHKEISRMNSNENLLTLTADIVAAHVGNNNLAVAEVPDLISSVYAALGKLGELAAETEPEFIPAITIRKSLSSSSHIISMIDGQPYKMLARHLGKHGLSPADYRKRYNLPADYPMTAPDYSAKRKAQAIKIGLGRKPKAVESAPEPIAALKTARKPRTPKAVAMATESIRATVAASARRGRKKLGIATA
jgi:predicted transcriptional regulator